MAKTKTKFAVGNANAGDKLSNGSYFLGHTESREDASAVECLKCGGYAPRSDSSQAEIDSDLNCGRSWACCCTAYTCKKCGTRMIGKRPAPEME